MTSPAKTQPQPGAGGEGIDHWDIATKMTQIDALKRELNGLANKPMTKEANGLKKPMTKEVPEKKSIGTIYQCVNCGSDYSARTVWQKKCPACSSKTKQEILNRKSVKPKGD